MKRFNMLVSKLNLIEYEKREELVRLIVSLWMYLVSIMQANERTTRND